MKKLALTLILLFAGSAFAQHEFKLSDASKYFDVKINVETCDEMYCKGKTVFTFYKKGGDKPYQVIELPDTQLELTDDNKALANVTMLYDHQSVINVDDYNFDGMEDIALCDGANGSYGGPSYRIYLSSRAAGKFVFSKAFTELGSNLGMFTVDKKTKTLETFDKSGCCYHITERYSVVGNKPYKIYVFEEDASIADEKRIRLTTKKRVGGKWKTTVKYAKREG